MWCCQRVRTHSLLQGAMFFFCEYTLLFQTVTNKWLWVLDKCVKVQCTNSLQVTGIRKGTVFFVTAVHFKIFVVLPGILFYFVLFCSILFYFVLFFVLFFVLPSSTCTRT